MNASDRAEDIELPAVVSRLAGGRPIRLVWRNGLGGLTYQAGLDPEGLFIKWAPVGTSLDLDLEAEAARMTWALPFTPVPRPLDLGRDQSGSWLVTQALPGESAVTERWRAAPDRAVRVIGEGLRAFHDALPVAECPFSWSAEERVRGALAAERAEEADGWIQDHPGLPLHEALEQLRAIPEPDRLVVCQGDACSPNTLIGPDGTCSGHVDLGRLGVADRWADLAAATMSCTWSYGPGW